ncbi:MAG: hypothetical protein PUP93_20440 [Rhizonema sp. NSF051]|nr:hypothetical protein [Rhizonema sp. NSF051]
MMDKQLFLAFCGTLVIFTPVLDWRIKIPVAAIATTPLTIALFQSFRQYEEKRSLKESLESEIKDLEINIDKLKGSARQQLEHIDGKRHLLQQEIEDAHTDLISNPGKCT